jgi:hypothetical protein
MAFQTSDFAGGATVLASQYSVDPAILDFVDLRNLSEYDVLMLPAGPFDILIQEIEWYPTANGASFNSDFLNAFSLSQAGSTALDLSSVGDGAQGSTTPDPQLSQGAVALSKGQLSEFIDVGVAQSSIDSNDITNVAQTAASKIDAVLGP